MGKRHYTRQRPSWKQKRKSHHDHFKERARERYGPELKEKHLWEIISLIEKGEAKFVKSQGKVRSIWIVGFRGINLIVVYDHREKQLITCLPREDAG